MREAMTALASRARGVLGGCGRLAGRGLALAVAAAMMIAMVGASAGTAFASARPHRDRYGTPVMRDSGLTLARAPAGLRAAVRRTLGTANPASSGLQKAKLTAPGGVTGSDFGNSVAISGSTAVVGAPIENSATGAAYVFVHSGSTWLQQAKLTASDGVAGDRLGSSVAISGSTVVLGAYFKNSGTGAAYVFTRSGSTWSQRTELTASDGVSGDDFGYSVALSGTTTVIGAFAHNSDAGAAYVFTGSGSSWTQKAKLTASNGGENDEFGFSVAISGSTAVVGAPNTNSLTGETYVFTRSTHGVWSQKAKLTASDGASGNQFGYSVALSGSTLLVGAPAEYNSAPAAAAYVFTGSGKSWAQQAELTDGATGDGFGVSVATSGSTALVGVPGSNSDTGAGYVFTRSTAGTWSQESELTASDGAVDDQFGSTVALSGSTAVVGTPYKNSYTGEAYVFVLPSQQAELTASDATTETDFGYSVAISGSTAVVGAPYGDGDTEDGSAYVFVRSATGIWSQQAELIASDPTGLSYFGYSVAISGSKVVVGATGSNSGAGAAYVFTRSATGHWSQKAELADPGNNSSDVFGYSVAISGSTALVSAPGSNSATGAAYVFAGSGGSWFQVAKLTASGGAAGDRFGYSVALAGSTALIGAPGVNTHIGAAYVFTGSGSTWSQQATLTASGSSGDLFGASVALAGSTAVVGAPAPNTGTTGAAYVFTGSGSTWSQQATLTAADGAANDAFGWSVAISNSTVVVGAIGRNTGTGAAYVFAGSGTAWSQQAELTANDGGEYDYFGAAVAVSGSTAVVPAYGKDSHTGAAYAFGNV
jgi:hypothetical protein